MADKIVLNKALGTYDVAQINNNFDKIATELNEKVLYRKNPGGTVNTMTNTLDMNSNRILNLPAPGTDNEPARLKDVANAIAGLAAQTANLIHSEPTANVAATTVQGAIAELGDSVKGLKDRTEGVVSIREFGAIGDGVVDDTSAIVAAKAYADSTKKALHIPAGTFRCSQTLTLNQGNVIFGDGQSLSVIKFTGTACMQSARAAAVDFVELRDFKIQQGGTGPVGLDIGTLRQAIIENISVWEFLIGVNLDIGVSLVANYWNRLINVTAAGPGKVVANSVGFNMGNNTNATYPDTDYNTLIGCKSFTCETGIRVFNAIGCTVVDHQCTEVTRGLSFFNGNNCRIEMKVENSTNMGFADVNTRANVFMMYNDGGNATPFDDNGWNYVGGQLLEFPTFSTPVKSLDCFVQDRVFCSFTTASSNVFQLNMNATQGVSTVKLAYVGYTQGQIEIAGVAEWDVFKVGSGTPKAVLSRMTGNAGGTASFNGTVMTVQSGTFAVGQTLTGVGIPVGTKINSFNFGGGGVGTECVLSNSVPVTGTIPVTASYTIFTVTPNADGTVVWTAAGKAGVLTVLNTVVNVQGIGGLQAYPYSRLSPYKRLV